MVPVATLSMAIHGRAGKEGWVTSPPCHGAVRGLRLGDVGRYPNVYESTLTY
jgi:hypothetical protein